MRIKAPIGVALPLLAAIVCLLLAAPAHAAQIIFSASTYNSTAIQNSGLFLDYLNGPSISIGSVSPFTPLVFTNGSSTTAATLLDTDANGSGTNLFSAPQALNIDFRIADVATGGGNFGSQAGVAFLVTTSLSPISGGTISTGLVMLVGGGSDTVNSFISLYSVDSTGALTPHGTPADLGANNSATAWYRLRVLYTVSGGSVSVVGEVFNHQTAIDPTSAVGTQFGNTFTLASTPLATLQASLQSTGQIGVANLANNSNEANVDIYDLDYEVPEPGTWMSLVGGLMALAAFGLRRRK